MRCRSCGGDDLDDQDNLLVCRSCGLILANNNISEEVVFSESSTGQSSVVGQYVSNNSTKGLSNTARKPSQGYGRDSREQTLISGRRMLQLVADALRLRSQHVDAANRLFQLAVQHNFIQGRRTQNVIAACLYIICRIQRTPHLLIDFSDNLQTNVYVLGSTFLKLAKILNVNIPIIDPSLYIHRFAAQLELKSNENSQLIDKTHMVAMSALRLVAKMKRDWISIGRRPSGICGACLLIAARMHGFKRSQKEILNIVKICDVTLRKRLLEFTASDSAELTFEQFESLTSEEIETCSAKGLDPPAFSRNRLAESQEKPSNPQKIQLTAQEIEEQLEKLLAKEEFQQLQDPIDMNEAVNRNNHPSIIKQAAESDNHDNNIEIDTFSDINDEEIDSMICTEEEVRFKTAAWESINANFIKTAQNKAKQANAESTGSNKKSNKRSANSIIATAASDDTLAAVQNINPTKHSSKVNYSHKNALAELFNEALGTILDKEDKKQKIDNNHSNLYDDEEDEEAEDDAESVEAD
jgi:transcription factor IIIB subunit 2